MQAYDLYQDIAQRTQGDVYVGVVGPVRTGKSTFIRRLMEKMVIPAIENAHIRARAQDDLPQSGSGRTVMTTKPAFIPSEAVDIALPEQQPCAAALCGQRGLYGGWRAGNDGGRSPADGTHTMVGRGNAL